jgi:hypothetical protein
MKWSYKRRIKALIYPPALYQNPAEVFMIFGRVLECSTGIMGLNEIVENFRWVIARLHPSAPYQNPAEVFYDVPMGSGIQYRHHGP